MAGFVVHTAPATEPVSLAEGKLHLKMDDTTADDALISGHIAAARVWAENETGRSFVNTIFTLYLDAFPDASGPIVVPRSPLVSVTHIKYYDTDGVLQTLSSSAYILNTAALKGEVHLAYGESWPSTQARVNAVEMRFTAGYGADATAVAENIKSAIKLVLGDLYENREASVTGTIRVDNPTALRLLGPSVIPEA